MIKNILIFLIIFFSVYPVFAQNNINAELLYSFKVGTGRDEVGESSDPFGTFVGVLLDTRHYNQYIFMDYPQNRFLYFDLDFNLLYSKNTKISSYGFSGYLDAYGNYFMQLFPGEQIEKFSKTFEKVFVLENNAFKYARYFYFYGDYLILEDMVIDQNGKILGDIEKKKILLKWFEESDYSKDAELKKALYPLVSNGSLIICGNRLYTNTVKSSNKSIILRYLEILSQHYKHSNTYKKFLAGQNFSIKGYDLNDNMYIRFYDGYDMFIVNKQMKILKYFNIIVGQTTFTNLQIMPNGDIIEQKGKNVYRIKNTWDPITNEEVDAWVKQQQSLMTQPAAPAADTIKSGKAIIKKLTASSTLTEPNDKNAYHPVKAFDNNPDTMWFEAVDGPGIGESLEVEFSRPITANAIVIEPGCFMKAYWEQNNRLKEITIYLDDKKIKARFSDLMKAQLVQLDEVTTFSKARFVIDSVYKTTK